MEELKISKNIDIGEINNQIILDKYS